MGLPNEPVTLLPDHIQELNSKLSVMRHNVNNHLSLVLAAAELIRRRPEMIPRVVDTLAEQPQKIMEELRAFSTHFEKNLNITRDPED